METVKLLPDGLRVDLGREALVLRLCGFQPLEPLRNASVYQLGAAKDKLFRCHPRVWMGQFDMLIWEASRTGRVAARFWMNSAERV